VTGTNTKSLRKGKKPPKGNVKVNRKAQERKCFCHKGKPQTRAKNSISKRGGDVNQRLENATATDEKGEEVCYSKRKNMGPATLQMEGGERRWDERDGGKVSVIKRISPLVCPKGDLLGKNSHSVGEDKSVGKRWGKRWGSHGGGCS